MHTGKLLLPREGGEYKSWFLWLAATGMTVLLLALTLLVTVPEYMTNDDVYFLRAIANIPSQGLAAVTNTIAHSAQEGTESMSILLCAVIGWFYKLDPNGYWYLGYHGVIWLVSLTVIFRCVIGKCRRRGYSLLVGFFLCAALYTGVFMYAVAELSFTVTAAMAGSAAVALVLCRDDGDARGWRILCDGGSVLLLLLCFLQRRATGLCLLCFFALAAAYRLARLLLAPKGQRRRPALCFSSVMAAGLAIILVCDFIGQGISSDEYHRAEHYRSLVVDYLNDEITAEDYAQVGIPRELATMIHGWYFMDERVTTDMLEAVSEVYYARQAQETAKSPLLSRLFTPVKALCSQLLADGQMQCRTGLMLCMLLLCAAAFFLGGRKRLPELLCALCAAGGAGLLLLRLISGGRFPVRTFLVVIIPAIVMLLLLLLSMEVKIPRRPVGAGFTALCLVSVFLCGLGMFRVPHITDTAGRAEVFADQWAMEDYANSRRDTTIITNIYDYVFDPLHSLDTYPTNTRVWGACGETARAPEERLYADTFFRDDVEFMSDNFAITTFLLQYLSVENGPVQARIKAQVTPAITAYDIGRITPGSGYTGWYEQNGLRYYFQNGQAVTGTHTIGGVEYEFAPAGADSAFFLAQSEDGSTVYSTYAYSLLSPEGDDGLTE